VRFLADECIWRALVDAIRAEGHRIDWVHEVSPSISDEAVLALSSAEELILLTEDSDFGELVFQRQLPAYAVVRVRLSRFEGEKKEVAKAVALHIATLGDRLAGRFTTIAPKRTRQRLLPAGKDDRT